MQSADVLGEQLRLETEDLCEGTKRASSQFCDSWRSSGTEMAHASRGIQRSYQDFTSDDEAPTVMMEPEAHLDDSLPFIVVPERKTDRWNHIEDLDSFFKKVYNYHQKHGFMCMFLETALQQLQFVFVIIFVTFLFSCVDYAILFKDKPVGGHNTTEHVKVKLKDAITPPSQCIAGVSGLVLWCLGIVLLFWVTKVIKEVFQLRQYLQVKRFYTTALHILPHELDNMTWHDVQQRLLEVQKEHEMCVHKKDLTELDVYHRILRHENYLVALINKEVIPVKYNLPFLGNFVFLSSGLRYNLEALLFWGPWAPFENSWHLKEEYRNGNRENHLAEQLSKSMLYIGLFNLALLPLILIWQLLFIIFSYADVVKREPGFLGARMWSEYSRVHLRHLNELDHELNSRLCMGYKAAARYMNSFTSHVTVVLCQNAVFFAGSFWVVLVGLTVWDEDFLAVEHIVTALAVLSMILAVCRAAIPDEHTVWFPEVLMKTILHHIHYMPDHWKGAAHTTSVRDEFSDLFTYKMTHLLSELFSPLLTPLIIIGPLRARAPQIVKFFCENTVTIQGVGDVCSFAQMDVAKHGDPQWTAAVDNGMTESEFPLRVPKPPPSKQAEMGKTELSLVHFKHTNPHWNPDGFANQRFLSGLEHNLASIQHQGQLVTQSLHSYTSMNPFSVVSLRPQNRDVPKGVGVTSAQGPITSYTEESFVASSIPGHPSWPPMTPAITYDLAAANMSASAVLLHESRRPRARASLHEGTERTPLLPKTFP